VAENPVQRDAFVVRHAFVARHAFVVRVWREEGSPWRGWVQHAGTREERYVQSLPDLLAFIQQWTGPLAQDEAQEAK
jgi:hypothetical protein